MRAYVTSSDDAQTSAMRARYGLTPPSGGELKARGARAARRPARNTHRTVVALSG